MSTQIVENRRCSSIGRDKEITATGFICQACLVEKPVNEQSPDPRYCRVCYDFLLKEAELLPNDKRPMWIPRPNRKHCTA